MGNKTCIDGDTINEATARAYLQSICENGLSIPRWAVANKFTPSYVREVLKGKLAISDQLADVIGLERIAPGKYRKILKVEADTTISKPGRPNIKF